MNMILNALMKLKMTSAQVVEKLVTNETVTDDHVI